jgi:diphosphate-dependent phosphofructokinase
MRISALQRERAKYQPKLPKSLRGAVKLTEGEKTESVADQKDIAEFFQILTECPLITFEAAKKGAQKTR